MNLDNYFSQIQILLYPSYVAPTDKRMVIIAQLNEKNDNCGIRI